MGKRFAQTLLAEGFVVYGATRHVDAMQDLVHQGSIALKMDITK